MYLPSILLIYSMQLTTILLLSFVSGAATQCTGSDHPSCSSWRTNGYCTNTLRTLEERKKYCGVSCGLCNTDGTQTALGGGAVVPACFDANPNCATWQTQTPAFCDNTVYSTAMKKLYCCGTCSAATATPTTTCGVIYEGTTINVNSAPTTALTPITRTNPLTRVFVKSGCSLKVYTDAVAPGTTATGSPFTGADAFVTLSGTATTAMSFECTCP